MKNIFVTREIPEVGLQMLRDNGYVVDVNFDHKIPTQDEIISMVSKKQYDAVITLLTDRIDTKVFDALPSVRMYSNYAVGFDNIDTVEAKKRGIIVANTPSPESSSAVAEHTIALLLALGRKIVEADRFTKEGKYSGWDPMNFLGESIKGKTLGLVGLGRIGKQTASLAKSLGLNILYTDVVKCDEVESSCNAVYVERLEDLLPKVDFLSIHVPLLDSTRHLINSKTISLMKKSAILINTSRGPVVEEKALVSALESGVIAGAGLDVFEFEPKISERLIAFSNVILTPHIASATLEAREEMSRTVASNIISFFETGVASNAINK